MTDRMLALTWLWGTPTARTPGFHDVLLPDTAFLLRLERRLKPRRVLQVEAARKLAA